MLFVIVNAFLDYTADGPDKRPDPCVGNVWGPFDTREEARTAIEEMNFPHPEHVYIRPLRSKD